MRSKRTVQSIGLDQAALDLFDDIASRRGWVSGRKISLVRLLNEEKLRLIEDERRRIAGKKV
jgi:hypothetical protein